MRVIVLGASGMLGSMVIDILSRDPEVAVSGTVRSKSLLEKAQERLPAVKWRLFDSRQMTRDSAIDAIDEYDWVINAMGITKPLIHEDNPEEIERSIWTNSILPHLIGAQAAVTGARVLQIATDCVYSGTKRSYLETDPHDALDVYGKTKSLGESMQANMHHLRCSIIGPEPKEYKFLLEWFRRQPRGAHVDGYLNHVWNGVTTLHFARICQGIIKSNMVLPHVQHVVPSGTATKSGMLRMFAQAYGREDIRIREIEAKDPVNRTLCTCNPELNQHLWETAGYVHPPTVLDMITELGRYNYRMADLR